MDPDQHPLSAALRAEAERRRAELPPSPEMPGPMRSALLREVARQHAAPERPRVTWLDRLFQWQAFFATAATAVVAVGFFAYSQGWFAGSRRLSQPEEQVAAAPAPRPASAAVPAAAGEKKAAAASSLAKGKAEEAQPPAAVGTRVAEASTDKALAGGAPALALPPPGVRELAAAPPPAPVAPAAPSVQAVPEQPRVSDELKLAETTTERRRLEGAPESERAPAPSAPSAADAAVAGSSVAGSGAKRDAATAGPGAIAAAKPVAPARKAAPATVTAPAPAAAPAYLGANVGQLASTQRFVQSPAGRKDRARQLPAEALLLDFTVSRTGNAVVVTDRDGSEYRGQIVAATTLARARGRAAKEGPPAEGGYAFRVSGQSRTLGQSVTLEGELLPVAESQRALPLDQTGRDARQNSRADGRILQNSSEMQNRAQIQTAPEPPPQNQLQLQLPLQNAPALPPRARFVGQLRTAGGTVDVEAASQ
ncbi:MAG: hypothetical protein JSR82_22760 [Verrucomicrobia bacterium]|nr:hypothetical protein [Verrucomicrobiota bacterium]